MCNRLQTDNYGGNGNNNNTNDDSNPNSMNIKSQEAGSDISKGSRHTHSSRLNRNELSNQSIGINCIEPISLASNESNVSNPRGQRMIVNNNSNSNETSVSWCCYHQNINNGTHV